MDAARARDPSRDPAGRRRSRRPPSAKDAADVAAPRRRDPRPASRILPPLPVMDPERAALPPVRRRGPLPRPRRAARAAPARPRRPALGGPFSSLLLLQFVAREIRREPRTRGLPRTAICCWPREHPLLQAPRQHGARRGLQARGAPGLGAGGRRRLRSRRAPSGIEVPESRHRIHPHRDTDGNPFFVTELVRVLAASAGARRADHRPAHHSDRRSARPSPGTSAPSTGCARALEAASVIGREFDVPLLAAVLRAESCRRRRCATWCCRRSTKRWRCV